MSSATSPSREANTVSFDKVNKVLIFSATTAAKLERSRQSARECRARKKLRYQYLEELVTEREKAVILLRKELDKYRLWSKELDEGKIPEGFEAFLETFFELDSIKTEQ
ncbi:hypothetical protein GE061_000300 [Apolygus lucorum]|uniref:BZIP domain-containing protein n=1 Tax=Apolygus lucorum TaxID=248454 RepID=A0A8S9Y472_APOLU|nr:hypothetical protein GE061_000300 [Apolygus lucorum]